MNALTDVPKDITVVRDALKLLRRFAGRHLYGGMMTQYHAAKEALESLNRIETALDDRQLPLPLG